MAAQSPPFNILIVGQSGRLAAEAALFAASLRASDPRFRGRLFVAEPQPGDRWSGDPRMDAETHGILRRLKAEVLPLETRVFGQDYPHGNKIEALGLLPEGEPFVFFDTDTLITGPLSTVPFDFDRPSASERVTGTWPKPTLYGPGMEEIWAALYDRFGLDFESSLDPSRPEGYWRRFLYFNAGWFYFRCPRAFGDRFLNWAREVRDDRPEALIGQSLDPWLDQIVLPLVIHSFGGGRGVLPPGLLDGTISCHYRTLPLAYAREDDRVIGLLEEVARPNWLKKVLKTHGPFRRMIYQGKGRVVRDLFDRSMIPKSEAMIRQKIKRAGLWMR